MMKIKHQRSKQNPRVLKSTKINQTVPKKKQGMGNQKGPHTKRWPQKDQKVPNQTKNNVGVFCIFLNVSFVFLVPVVILVRNRCILWLAQSWRLEIFLYFLFALLVSVVILVRNKCILWLPLLCRLDVWVVRDRPAGLQWRSSRRRNCTKQTLSSTLC